MSAKIKVQVTTPGAKAAADALLRLSAAERKVALEAAGVSRAMKKTGRDGKSASSSMLSGFSKVGGSLVGIGTAAAAIAASVRLIRSEFDRLKKIDLNAFTAQRSLMSVASKFIVNNPQTSREDVSAFMAMSRDAGAVLGPGGGVAAFNALIAVRGQTPGASAAAQVDAVRTAIGLKALDPDVDVQSFAVNAIKLQESAAANDRKLSMDQAFRTLLATGARAGGDVSELASAMIQMTGAEGLATGNTLPELLSLFAFGTAETGDVTGKPTASTVSSLLTRLQTRPVKLAGTGEEIETFGATGLDKLLNLVDRLRAGEFGDQSAEVIKAIAEGGGDVKGVALVSQLVAKLERYETTRMSITRDFESGDIVEQMRTMLFEIVPGAKEAHDEQTAKGKTDRGSGDKSRAGRRAIAMSEIEELRELHDVGAFEGPFLGGAGVGHTLSKLVDVKLQRRGGIIKKEGQAMVTDILARRLMEDPGLDMNEPGLSTAERLERGATIKEMFKAKTPDELAKIIARRTLGGQDLVHESRGGIDALDTAILRFMGASGAETTALQLADLSDELLREKLGELITALRENTAEAGENRLGKTTTETTTTTTPTTEGGTVPPVPIDANDL